MTKNVISANLTFFLNAFLKKHRRSGQKIFKLEKMRKYPKSQKTPFMRQNDLK